MMRALIGRLAGLAAMAAAAATVCAASGDAGTIRALAVTPDVGISPVVLGEPAGEVSKQLGIPIESPGSGYDSFETHGAILEVAFTVYGLHPGPVDVVASNSAPMTLYGLRLALGRRALTPLLRSHHWRLLECGARSPAAAHSSRSGRTLIEWTVDGPAVTVRRSSPSSSPCDWVLP